MTDWQYVVLKPAQKYLERMQPHDQMRIITALDRLLTEAETLDIKSLKGRSDRRLRIGQYRVLFIEDRAAKTYVITTIAARGDVYK